METIWTQSNQGDTTTFWSCGICGASVQTQDREQHEAYHEAMTMTPRAANRLSNYARNS